MTGPKSILVYLYLLWRAALTPSSTPHSSFFHRAALFCAAQHKHSSRRPPTAFLCLQQIQWLCFPSNSMDVINDSVGRHFVQWHCDKCISCSRLLGVVDFNPELLFTPKCLDPISSHTTSPYSPTSPVLQSGSGRRMQAVPERPILHFWKSVCWIISKHQPAQQPSHTVSVPGTKHAPFQQGIVTA